MPITPRLPRSTSRTSRIAAAVACLMLALPAAAADVALYDEMPPEDAVFIRWLDDSADSVTLYGQTLKADPTVGTAYVAISAADLQDAPAGAYLSIFGADRVIAEPARPNTGKVHLMLVNGDDDPVRLVVAGQGAEVVAPTGPGDAASRAVNPVAATLAVERVADGAELGRFDLQLSRGQNLSFVVRDGTAELVENRFGPVLHLN